MGHRHLTNMIQLFEIEHYQNPTNVAAERSDVPIGILDDFTLLLSLDISILLFIDD